MYTFRGSFKPVCTWAGCASTIEPAVIGSVIAPLSTLAACSSVIAHRWLQSLQSLNELFYSSATTNRLIADPHIGLLLVVH